MGPAAPSLVAAAGALIDTGRWVEADEHLEKAAALAAVHKWRHLQIDVEALRVTLRALRGEPVDTTADPGWTAVGLEENRATHARILRAAGTVAGAAGDFDNAFRQSGRCSMTMAPPCTTSCHRGRSPTSAAAAQRTGRQEEAAHILAVGARRDGAGPTTWMTLLMHHAAARPATRRTPNSISGSPR
ncbi:hypothetical protein ACFRCI_49005 [Streptomyces sp. NPDC056638]|uniref:hypothetical protein n=1 Tax=Streptomyces sp. NPDC056638 TaxID=3345887 RepID=UPI0036A7C44A